MTKWMHRPWAKSAEDVAANIEDFVKGMQAAAAAALYAEAHELKNAAIPLTPMDTGDLRRSAFVTLPELRGKSDPVSVKVGFGGSATKYALAVHELSKEGVNWSEPGTGAKYLERPFNDLQGSLAANIARRVGKDLEQNRVDLPSPKGPTGPKGGG